MPVGIHPQAAAMLVHQGEARSSRNDRHLAMTLAGIAGAVNTGVFEAVGFFAANMTGNVSSVSDHAALGQGPLAAFALLIVAAFIIGAACSTLLINFGRRRGMTGIYALSILAEAILMAALGLADPTFPPAWRGTILVVGLSLLMGLQNATVTRISNARVRTTHVSGMVTDIGIGLGTLLDIVMGHEPDADREAVLARLRLHGLTVFSFVAGGFCGVLVYRAAHGLLFVVCAALLLLVALPEAIKARTLGQNGA